MAEEASFSNDADICSIGELGEEIERGDSERRKRERKGEMVKDVQPVPTNLRSPIAPFSR